jgi:hypothetical protein
MASAAPPASVSAAATASAAPTATAAANVPTEEAYEQKAATAIPPTAAEVELAKIEKEIGP